MATGIRLNRAEILEKAFGGWPSFHDAEILNLELDRSGPTVLLHTLTFTSGGGNSQARNASDEMAERQHYKVTFRFDVVDNFVLEDFNHQNVIWGLAFKQVD
jgi:hypothetical protein